MIETIYGALLGALAGLAVHRISLFQIRRRSDDTKSVEAVENAVVIALCVLISAVLFGLIFWKYPETLKRLEYASYMLIALNIAIIDIDIRKIPNDSVLALLVVKTAVIIASIIMGAGVWETVFPSVVGLGVGFILYILPSYFRVPISPGDVKYCAAIGYCLGIYAYLEVSIVMAISLFIYLAYLLVSKKGGMKTVTMMGPHLSLGVIVAMLIPYNEIMEALIK